MSGKNSISGAQIPISSYPEMVKGAMTRINQIFLKNGFDADAMDRVVEANVCLQRSEKAASSHAKGQEGGRGTNLASCLCHRKCSPPLAERRS